MNNVQRSTKRLKPGVASAAAGRLAAGPFHTCAIKSDATAACWGHGSSGEVLPGSFSDQWMPQVVPSLSGMTYVAVGYRILRDQYRRHLIVLGRRQGCYTIRDGNNASYTGVKAVAMGYVHRCEHHRAVHGPQFGGTVGPRCCIGPKCGSLRGHVGRGPALPQCPVDRGGQPGGG